MTIPRDAVTCLRARRYSLVVIDCGLNAAWLQMLRECRRHGGDVPIVVTATVLDVRVAVLAVRTGATDVIPGPLAWADLSSIAQPVATGENGRDCTALRELTALLLRQPRLPLRCASRSLGMERHRLERVVRLATGESFRQWRQRRAMMTAADSVASTDVALKVIALDLGYRTTGAFSRAFRTVMGSSPSAYRRLHDTHKRAASPE